MYLSTIMEYMYLFRYTYAEEFFFFCTQLHKGLPYNFEEPHENYTQKNTQHVLVCIIKYTFSYL